MDPIVSFFNLSTFSSRSFSLLIEACTKRKRTRNHASINKEKREGEERTVPVRSYSMLVACGRVLRLKHAFNGSCLVRPRMKGKKINSRN